MSTSDTSLLSTADLVDEVLRRCDGSIEPPDANDHVTDAQLGLLLASAIRLLAARAQDGTLPQLASGNHTISATDGLIACTAILETIGVEVFELSAWQALTDVGSTRRARSSIREGYAR